VIRNGIDIDHLAALGEVVVDDPAAAIVSARVRTRWDDRYRTRATTEELELGRQRIPRGTTLPVDLPHALGGTDRGPTPGELLLAALGSCVAQAFVEGAAMTGIPVERLEIAVEGQLDLRGTAGIDGVRPGMSRIHLDVAVEAGAGEAEVDALLTEALRRSPVADSLTAGVEVGARVRQPRPAQGSRPRR
jgi:uncharacterized OsmC-like protein